MLVLDTVGWRIADVTVRVVMTSMCSITPGMVELCRAYIGTVLNLILCRTGSQCKSRITGIIYSNLLIPVTKRAAAFCVICSS